MLTAVISATESGVHVAFAADAFVQAEEAEEEVPPNDLNPIAPELKEMMWGYGAFIVLLVAMRLYLFPKLRKGMQRRYESIEADHEAAEAVTSGAKADVAEYEARLTSVRAEAQHKIEAARATLEAERAERLAAVNAEIAARRAAAANEVDAARAAAMGDVEDAVVDVVGRAAEMALRTDAPAAPIDDSVVRTSVRSTMGAEVSS